MTREKVQRTVPGWLMLPSVLLLEAVLIGLLVRAVATGADPSPFVVIPWIFTVVATGLLLTGLFVVNPNDAKVLVLFGKYGGTVKTRRVSLGQSALSQAAPVAASPELREFEDQGQRSGRQPHRNRRSRRLACR